MNIGYKDYKGLIHAFRDIAVGRLRNSLISLVLYGSVARNEAKKESDIDLLIILRDASHIYYERLKPFIEIEKELEKNRAYRNSVEKGFVPYLSYVILSQKEAQENLYLFLDMIEGSIILLDNEDFFKRKLEKLKQRLNTFGSKKIFLEDGSWYWDLKPDLLAGEVFEL
ncbi:MAG: nucleotidyltransferase domain-containing protein [Candidatus Methanoperedenaceae archaeon]|nr:nucleotidyltransferase domain-containing protein [Euryarchaeota archaeon]MCG2727634.1 nucleotidyltransferase domain-containing protein [Candidatus Methanoperedenaceae archaeon]